jgi:DNA-binding SARP family transcriptional activator
MSQLYIRVFGSPEIIHGEQVLSFSSRKEKALLLYLAVEGRHHLRKELLRLFWPNLDSKGGHTVLRGAIMHLRKGLDHTHMLEEQAHLIVERRSLEVALTSDVVLDLHPLAVAWQLIQDRPSMLALWTRQAHQEVSTLFDQALGSYRGMFLADFSLRDAPLFDEWTRMQSQQWHVRMMHICETAVHWQEMAGDTEQAIRIAVQWLALDHLQEKAYCALMQLYITQGDRVAALRVYEQCCSVLSSELQIEPASETVALAQRIRTTLPLSHLPPLSSSNPPTSPLLELPFVGRSAEFNALTHRYQAASGEQPQVILIEGEAGIGKTRLSTTFLKWAEVQGADVLQGRAFETQEHLPYQLLIEALRPRLDRENAPEDLLPDVWLAELARLFPELRERYPDLSRPESDETTGRAHLFEAIFRLLRQFMKRAPLVLFFDDLQWADSATLDVLTYLIHQQDMYPSSLMLLMTTRHEALSSHSIVSHWLMIIRRSSPLVRFSLCPFDAQEMATIVARLITQDEHALAHKRDEEQIQRTELSQWLYAQTQGQPLYLIETLKTLLEQEVLVWQQTDTQTWTLEMTNSTRANWSGIMQGFLPPTMREHIRQRFINLAPPTQHVLIAGAVLGQNFRLSSVCQIAKVDENVGVDAVEEALQKQIVQEKEPTRSWSEQAYVFTHEKVREVIYNEAGEVRRKLYHQRAFKSVQDTKGPAVDLAYHALAAGLLKQAFHYILVVGDEARKVFAAQEAITAYEQARDLLEHVGSGQELSTVVSVSEVHHLYTSLGCAYELLNQWDQAALVYQQLLSFAQEHQEAELECQAILCLATLATECSFDTHTLSTVTRPEKPIRRKSEVAEILRTNWHIGHLAHISPSSLTYGMHALKLARDLNASELVLKSLRVISQAHISVGRWDEGEASLREAITLSRSQGNQSIQAESLALLAAASLYEGQPHAAVDNAREAYQISLQIKSSWIQGRSMMFLALGLVECGDYEEALTIALTGVQEARALGSLGRLAGALHILGVVFLALLRLDDASTAYQEALEINQKLQARAYTELISAKLCAIYALQSEWNAARTWALQALEARGDALSKAVLIIELHRWWETEALLRGGDEEQAKEDVHRLGQNIGLNHRYRIPYLHSVAMLEQWHQKPDQAITYLNEAATLAEEIGLPGELWQIQAALGELYLSCRQIEQADKAFAGAAMIIHELANRIQDEALRRDFLHAQQIKWVLDKQAEKQL